MISLVEGQVTVHRLVDQEVKHHEKEVKVERKTSQKQVQVMRM